MKIIKLESEDKMHFNVDVEIAKCSGVIKTMIDDCHIEVDEDSIVPLPNVNSATLRKILEWANHYKNNYETSNKEGENYISSWDIDFLDVDQGTLFELIMAANYLDIKKLYNMVCQYVANLIKLKSSKEIRGMFHIRDEHE